MSRVQIALAAGLAGIVLAVLVVLTGSPVAVLATNGVATNATLALANTKATACQPGERLPKGTRAIRMSLGSFTGPAVSVHVYAGGHLLASGEHGSNWAGQTVTVPIGLVTRTVYPVKVCFAAALVRGEALRVDGADTKPAVAARSAEGEALPGRVQIEYLTQGSSSWLSLLPSVARHMGLGRAWHGAWVAFLALALMIAIATLATRTIAGELHE
jgi:hypothetical protein